MAIRLSHQTIYMQFEKLRGSIEQIGLEAKARFATGPDEQRTAADLIALYNRCGNWLAKMAQLRAAAQADSTLVQYMKDQLADQGYDGVAMVNAIEDACDAIQTAIATGMPVRQQDGHWAVVLPQGGQVRWRVFTPAVLAPLHQDPPATPHLLTDLINAVR